VTNEIYLGKTITLKSKILNEDRPIFISTPEGYDNSDQKYPVLYLLDAGTHFLHTTGIAQFLSRAGRIPQMVIVAIPNTNRNRDFTPSQTDEMPNSGGANNFLDFTKEELIPYVKNNYRIQPYSILFGHSLTGMFALHSFASRNELFNAYIIASPYLMYDNEIVLNTLESFAKNSPSLNNSLYITVGNEPDYFPSLKKLAALLDNCSLPDSGWKYVKMESEDHGSVPHKTIYDGLEFIYSNWRVTDDLLAKGIDTVDEHYKMLSDKFGYEIDIPEFLLNQLGYRYLNQNLIKEAIKIFKRNIKNYPNSANVYDSMGDAYFAADQFDNAKKNYSLAVQIGKESSDPNLQIYKNNLERAINKILE
jgi:predicted alpha/beta superfamily hydrolase